MRNSAILMTVLSAASAVLAQGVGDGFYNTDADFVVALDVATMNAHSTGNPNTNPLCGKQIAITGPDGKKASATVVDTCPGCAPNSIDLSPAAFQQLASFDVGRLHGVSWTFVNRAHRAGADPGRLIYSQTTDTAGAHSQGRPTGHNNYGRSR